MVTIREFVKAMAGCDVQEITLAVGSVKIYKHHFDAALKRVRPSRAYRFNEKERAVLDKALTALKMADYADDENDKARKGKLAELDWLLMRHQKDFSAIKKIIKSIET